MTFVHEDRLRWALRAAAILSDSGAEPVSGLVLPNGDFFPDAFDGSPDAVLAQLRRVLEHAGLADVAVELQLVTPEGEVAGGCKSGGCSAPLLRAPSKHRVARVGDRFVVAVSTGEARHPTALMTALVRAASAIFLTEAELDDEIEPREHEGYVDAAGAILGFGVLLSNGSHITHKGCSGVTVQSATALPLEEQALLLALSCALYGLPGRVASSELDAEARRRFDEARAWVDANRGVVELVRQDRRAIEADRYTLAEPGSWLTRLFRGRRSAGGTPTGDELDAIAREVVGHTGSRDADAARAKARRMASLRDAVDEAFE
jgi:hypothetical protein